MKVPALIASARPYEPEVIIMTRTNTALTDHAYKTHTDAKAVESHVNRLLSWPSWPVNLEDITARHINAWVAAHSKDTCPALIEPLSPSTIGTRLSVLKKAMQRHGVAWPVDVKMPQRSKRPKWVISREQQERLVGDLRGQLCVTDAIEFSGVTIGTRRLMADYIEFVTETGLRVEEVLRIERRHLIYTGQSLGEAMSYHNPTLEVMGTKTASSYDLIPLSEKAHEVLLTRMAQGTFPLFPIKYEALQDLWMECRKYLNVTDETATLKSLRRTFASRMAAKGIPAPLLQKLMRHASLTTTSEYTNTIGMHEAARQWLS